MAEVPIDECVQSRRDALYEITKEGASQARLLQDSRRQQLCRLSRIGVLAN